MSKLSTKWFSPNVVVFISVILGACGRTSGLDDAITSADDSGTSPLPDAGGTTKAIPDPPDDSCATFELQFGPCLPGCKDQSCACDSGKVDLPNLCFQGNGTCLQSVGCSAVCRDTDRAIQCISLS